MKTNAVLQVRIDQDIKKEAEELFERLGISIADAVRMFVVQSIEAQGLPFEVRSGFKANRTLHAYGIAGKHANPAMIAAEKDAWEKAAVRKYENT